MNFFGLNNYEFCDFSPQILSTDFEIGHFLRARVIPKATLYYTGDIVEDDDDDDYDEGNRRRSQLRLTNDFPYSFGVFGAQKFY